MNVHVARPAAKQLSYQLYARVLHPELFDTSAAHVIERAEYVLDVRICEAGHVVQLHRNGDVTSEINVDGGIELPKRRRCFSVKLNTGQDISVRPYPDVSFQASTQIESLDDEVFERLTAEFRSDARRATLFHAFGSRNRMRPEPLSLLFADCSPRTVVIHAFHTFPDDLAVIRTQSLYEF
ncbi:MAG: DUF2617 family protein [Planctomycetaceae bacterium]|nr:DUF2617 family protein [Planctomycetaceae bacterium]